MLHSFNPEVAADVGIEAAILYQNIQYWCEKNRLNEQNFFDGQYWTYNTIKAFCDMFPYMTKGVIYRNLEKLEKAGYIATGNYNKSAYDRTKWYADIRFTESEKPSFQIWKMDSPSAENDFPDDEKPIPNINTNINSDIKPKKERKKETFDDVLDSTEIIRENPDLREAFVEYIKMRKLIKKPLTDRALKLNINDAFKLSGGDAKKMQAIVEQSIQHSWAGMYELKTKTQSKQDRDSFFSDLLKEMEVQNEAGNDCEGVASLPSPLSAIL